MNEFNQLKKEALQWDMQTFKEVVANHEAVCESAIRMLILASHTKFPIQAEAHVINLGLSLK